MPVIDRDTSALLVMDFQSRLMPAIEDDAAVVANARRLLDTAEIFRVPIIFIEQNAEGLGDALSELRSSAGNVAHKMTFDACRAPGFAEMLPGSSDIIVSGCE